MSSTLADDAPPRSALGLLWRLLTAGGRNRADLCYAFMGTRNCPSRDCMYLNLGYWPGTQDYCTAAQAMVDLLGDAAGIQRGETVVDAGCGFGDQDVRLAQRHDPARIHAINVTALQIEHARQPEVFSSIPASFWWAMVTFNTIGYGDMVPLTPFGRLFASLAAVFGVGVFALPTAIVIAAIIESSASGSPYVCEACGHHGLTSHTHDHKK